MILPDKLGRLTVVRLEERWVDVDPFRPGFSGAELTLIAREADQRYTVRYIVSAEALHTLPLVREHMFDAMRRA